MRIAENAVEQYFETEGWNMNKSQMREGLTNEQNKKLSLGKMDDPTSLAIRHYPDHTAIKGNHSLLIQTKWAEPNYEDFVAEKASIDQLLLQPKGVDIIAVFFIWKDAKFSAYNRKMLEKIIPDCNVCKDGGHTGSGTPYYWIPRNKAKDLSKILNDLAKGNLDEA